MNLSIIDRPLDNTALNAFMTCEKSYEYSMKRNLRLRLGDRSIALSYGTLWHKILETHYKTGGDFTAVVQAAEKCWDGAPGPDDPRTMHRGLLEYQKYVDKWGDEFKETLGWPDEPLVEVSTNALLDETFEVPYAVKIDRFIRISSLNFIEDHKTSSRDDKSYFKGFELSNQMMGYVFVAGLIIGQPVQGVRINRHIVRKNDSVFDRQIISYSTKRLNDWKDNHKFWVAKIEKAYETGVFARNYNACNGKYSICQFANICSMPSNLQEDVISQDYETHVWNPLTHGEEDGSIKLEGD